MRRALASLLLALFSFPLISPMLRADTASNMPSCCRREGKHHCSMGSADAASGPALQAVQPKCCNYPAAIAMPGDWSVVLFKNSPPIAIALLSYPPVEAQAEAQYRVSFSRSRQKRGPPSLLD
jgi:hypothetical protein